MRRASTNLRETQLSKKISRCQLDLKLNRVHHFFNCDTVPFRDELDGLLRIHRAIKNLSRDTRPRDDRGAERTARINDNGVIFPKRPPSCGFLQF